MLSNTEASYVHIRCDSPNSAHEGTEKKAKMTTKNRSKCPVIIAVSVCSVVNATLLSGVVCMWVRFGREIEDLRRSYQKLQFQHSGPDWNETALVELAVEKHLTEQRERETGNAWVATNFESRLKNMSHGNYKPIAHLTGSPQAKFVSDDRNGLSKIKAWETNQGLATIANGMKYKRGSLIVPADGLYFIYSQLYYRFLNPIEEKGGKTYQLIHYTFKQNSYPKPLQIMKSARNTCWSKNVEFGLYTSYQGGVFRLQKGDRIYVAVSNMSMVCLDETASYFGAFMI